MKRLQDRLGLLAKERAVPLLEKKKLLNYFEAKERPDSWLKEDRLFFWPRKLYIDSDGSGFFFPKKKRALVARAISARVVSIELSELSKASISFRLVLEKEGRIRQLEGPIELLSERLFNEGLTETTEGCSYFLASLYSAFSEEREVPFSLRKDRGLRQYFWVYGMRLREKNFSFFLCPELTKKNSRRLFVLIEKHYRPYAVFIFDRFRHRLKKKGSSWSVYTFRIVEEWCRKEVGNFFLLSKRLLERKGDFLSLEEALNLLSDSAPTSEQRELLCRLGIKDLHFRLSAEREIIRRFDCAKVVDRILSALSQNCEEPTEDFAHAC